MRAGGNLYASDEPGLGQVDIIIELVRVDYMIARANRASSDLYLYAGRGDFVKGRNIY